MPLDSLRIILSASSRIVNTAPKPDLREWADKRLTRAPNVRLSILAWEVRSTSSKDAGLGLDALLEAIEEARGRIQGAVPNISE